MSDEELKKYSYTKEENELFYDKIMKLRDMIRNCVLNVKMDYIKKIGGLLWNYKI